MELVEYERMREHERSYWWHVARRSLLADVLRWGVPEDPERPGLDLGCGTGANFGLLAPFGRFVGSEVEGTLWADGRPRPERPVLLARGESLPFPDECFGLCTFFDVLEHVDAEDAFLREIRRVLRPGGRIFLSVPAYMFLWSDHDVSLHHHRRYIRRTLRDSLTRNGLEVVRVTYAMASILPLVAGYRLLSRLVPRGEKAKASYVPTPEPLNHLLTRVVSAEGAWLKRADLPFGTSLFAIARRPAGEERSS
jgi:SAM-dependent methyltransferase